MQPVIKMWSDKARESAMRVRRGGTALGSQAPQQQGGVTIGGTTVSPAIAARVKEILAEKAAKGKKKGAGGKGKGKAAKPKDVRTPQEKKNQNRAQIAKQTGVGDLEGTMVRLNAGMQGAGMENDKHDKLIEKGLAERHADGTVTLSAAGKKWKAAADRGDVEAAQGALTDAQAGKADKDAKAKATADKQQARDQAKAERTKAKAERVAARQKKAKKALDMTDLAIKAGARHSATDMKHIQAAHDSTVMAGATCAPGDGADEAATAAIKGIMDDPGYFAQHECGDIMQAASGLSTLCLLIQSELSEEDEDQEDITQLCDAARTLVDFISSELDDLEQAAKDDATEDQNEPVPMAGKAIAAREDVSAADKKRAVAKYGDVEYADEKNKKYPLDTESNIRAANSYIGQAKNQAMYSASEVATIKNKIVAAWKRLIDKAGPPSAAKAWHLDGGAIKALDDDTIHGCAVLFGTKAAPDLERDYYDKNTDLWLDHFGWPRPITYHHGMDAGTRDDPVVGHWTKATVTDEGVWLTGQLDRAHRYYKAIKELAQRGYLKMSSDSGPQWVIREPQSNGANYVKRWPLVTSSVTVTPMEPRMLPVEIKAFLADLGYEAIDEEPEAITPDAAKADGRKAADDERARRILLELDLLTLEETAL